jgi:hypothetical protein
MENSSQKNLKGYIASNIIDIEVRIAQKESLTKQEIKDKFPTGNPVADLWKVVTMTNEY